MIQTLDETQREISALAVETFARYADPARLERIESTPDVFDAELWGELARTGLLGVVVPEEHGGLGMGMLEAGLVLEAAGAAVTMVPIAETLTVAYVLAGQMTAQSADLLSKIASGEAIFAVAPSQSVARDGLTGVPWAHIAHRVVFAQDDGVVMLDPAASKLQEREATTARVLAAELPLEGAALERLEEVSPQDLANAWRTALASFQAGVTDAAVKLTASYTSGREQFGKPLSTFQGVALRAADASIDAKSVRAAARCAGWTLDQADAAPDAKAKAALTAAWWAADAGQRCVHSTQHLHGGMGADITYPVHRYFLFGKQVELLLGGASALLAELGDLLAA